MHQINVYFIVFLYIKLSHQIPVPQFEDTQVSNPGEQLNTFIDSTLNEGQNGDIAQEVERELEEYKRTLDSGGVLQDVYKIEDVVPAIIEEDVLSRGLNKRQIDVENDEVVYDLLEEADDDLNPSLVSDSIRKKRIRPAPAFHG